MNSAYYPHRTWIFLSVRPFCVFWNYGWLPELTDGHHGFRTVFTSYSISNLSCKVTCVFMTWINSQHVYNARVCLKAMHWRQPRAVVTGTADGLWWVKRWGACSTLWYVIELRHNLINKRWWTRQRRKRTSASAALICNQCTTRDVVRSGTWNGQICGTHLLLWTARGDSFYPAQLYLKPQRTRKKWMIKKKSFWASPAQFHFVQRDQSAVSLGVVSLACKAWLGRIAKRSALPTDIGKEADIIQSQKKSYYEGFL